MAAIFIKLATTAALPLTFYRLVVGSVILLVALLVSRRRVNWRALLVAVPSGLLLCGDMACFFSAVKLTSVANATIIGALQPAIVMLAAGPLFGERSRRADVAWTALAVAGVCGVVIGSKSGATGHVAGDLLAVASLLFWSAYFLVSKRARRDLGALEYTFGVTLVAAVAMVPIVAVSGQHFGGIRAGDWVWISLLAVIPGSGHLLMNWAHRIVDVSVSSVIGAGNPVFAVTAAWLVLHQSLRPIEIAGVVLALAGFCAVAGRRRVPPAASIEPVADPP